MMEQKKKKKSVGKRLLIALCIVLAVLCAAGIIGGNFLFSFALNRDAKFGMEQMIMGQLQKEMPEGVDSTQAYSGLAGTPEMVEWFTAGAEDIYLTAADGLKLHAYQIVNETVPDRYVLLFHGYSGHAGQMVNAAKHFFDMGFSVLAPDARAHGKSEGSVRGMGWLERKDNLLWIDRILSENENASIALYGISMGGATVMMLSGEDALPPQVKVAVEDCGYSSVWEEFKAQLSSIFHLPAFPMLYIADAVTQRRGGYGFKEASSVEQVRNCEIPMLFIHGDSDNFVPFSMLDVCYDAATCEKEKLVVEGAAHGLASSVDPETYWNTVKAFVTPRMAA